MLINATNMEAAFLGMQTAFLEGVGSFTPEWKRVAMHMPSATETEDYSWLNGVPALRRWVGDKRLQSLKSDGFKLANENFEATWTIPRSKFEDDTFGVFATVARSTGVRAAQWPDRFAYALLNRGWDDACYDKKPFFSQEHPLKDGVQSNDMGGSGTPWFLICGDQGLMPVIFQERKPPHLVPLDDVKGSNVHTFMRAEYIYSIEARGAFGFGLWQLAVGSKQPLDSANFNAAYNAMLGMKDWHGEPMGIRPTLLVAPPSLRGAAKQLLEVQVTEGSTNTDYKAVDYLISPYL